MRATSEQHGRTLVMDATGDFPVYPGHALVVAYEIINVFPDIASALERTNTESRCPAALADNRISGAGGEVYTACELLTRAKAGESVEALMDWADEVWVSGSAGGHTKSVEPGLAQAAKLKPQFAERLTGWLAA
jgi:hypothetical protein